ncbi:MAG: hypothetical protein ACTMIL_12750 [Brevibacterium aurantiacum]
MTTDDKTMIEQIETALQQATFDGADRTEEYAAAVLPIIRKAQADALRDAAREEFQFSPNVHYQGIRVHERLVKRADRIEKGTDHD